MEVEAFSVKGSKSSRYELFGVFFKIHLYLLLKFSY